MKTGLITSDTYQNHNTGEGHPEKIDRVTSVIENFKKLDNKNIIWKKPSSFDHNLLKDVPDSLNKMIAGNIQIEDIYNLKGSNYMIDISRNMSLRKHDKSISPYELARSARQLRGVC